MILIFSLIVVAAVNIQRITCQSFPSSYVRKIGGDANPKSTHPEVGLKKVERTFNATKKFLFCHCSSVKTFQEVRLFMATVRTFSMILVIADRWEIEPTQTRLKPVRDLETDYKKC